MANLNCKELRELTSKISDGTHFTPNYTEKGKLFLSAINVSDNYFDLDAGYKYISEQEHRKLYSRCNPEYNDVLMRKVGVGPRKACVVPKTDENFSIFVSVALLKCKDINPYFLSTFINSKIGQKQLFRFNKGISQPDLHLEDIARLKVPLFSFDFQSKIEQIVKSAHEKLAESKNAYKEAEDLLLTELGLDSWEPSKKNVSEKHFSDFILSGRLDAEFYQSKYDELEERLKSVSYRRISELQIYNTRGVQPYYVDDGDVSVINSKHILENGLDYDNFEKTTEKFLKENDRAKIKYGDILIYTTGANIGRSQVYMLSTNSLASNHVNILRLKDINPIYAALVLNSKVGRMQTEKACTGSAQAELYPSDIEKFIIPILSFEIQDKIAEKVKDSFDSYEKCKFLLNQAKRMVENEIEKVNIS